MHLPNWNTLYLDLNSAHGSKVKKFSKMFIDKMAADSTVDDREKTWTNVF